MTEIHHRCFPFSQACERLHPNTHTNNDGEWEMKEQRCKEKTVGVDLFRVIPTKILSISVATLFEVISLGWALMTAAMSTPCVCVRERNKKEEMSCRGCLHHISVSVVSDSFQFITQKCNKLYGSTTLIVLFTSTMFWVWDHVIYLFLIHVIRRKYSKERKY